MTKDENSRDHIQSLERGFAVLLAFDAERPNPTLAELASATGLSRPAVRRILLTLQRLGYVHGEGGRWSLTPRVLSIGQHYSASHALIEIAQPHLVRLAERTSESASLAALDGTDVVYIARVPVRRIMSINVSIGTRVPAHATSMGRVLLAWAPDSVVADVVGKDRLPAYTRHTITDPGELRRGLAQIRQSGYSIVAEELEDGLLSVAAPVRDRAGTVVAALASSTSSGRATVEQLRSQVAPLVVRTAEQISADYGHPAAVGKATSAVHTPRDGFF
ncbi:IclR family transcriptional regulator domain-containing protein [Prauserella muralis]|uniref:Glycerol operon regulatory protein n=1 Tax=Prauserella muralis TaxID=588067 RepID=A0A2V4AQG0_9PSEU|nr:IclR family transcriptional regulator C-terminal domain-containing protein [Prauserella muralis]PXY22599.1 IclR family transcriptional regulator [Prauserella muralis]TWE28301.1 IclR family transcriptional regulator [Prauserella muralis]